MAKLARFTGDESDKEFVVIFDGDDPDTSEYAQGGFSLAEMVDVQGDVTTFPCDRELRSNSRRAPDANKAVMAK